MESGFPIGVGDKLRRNDGLWSLDSRSLIGVGDKLRRNDGLLGRIQYWFRRLIIVTRQVASAQNREWRLLRQVPQGAANSRRCCPDYPGLIGLFQHHMPGCASTRLDPRTRTRGSDRPTPGGFPRHLRDRRALRVVAKPLGPFLIRETARGPIISFRSGPLHRRPHGRGQDPARGGHGSAV